MTSARAVSRVKKLLPRKTKVGHTGTLDPLASGLLAVMIGKATRLSRYVTDLDKSYTATARFGAVSDTLDAEGEVRDLDAEMLSEEDIRATLPRFTGEIEQVPPMASAVKVGGQRLYDLHRQGLEVERESRAVTIRALDLDMLDSARQLATFEISCSSGTYIRTLIADIAASLGTGAYLTDLRRTRVGSLHLSNATPEQNLTSDTIYSHIIHMREVVSHLPAVEVCGEERRAVSSGRSIEGRGIEGSFRVEEREDLLAIYRCEGDEARPEAVLCAE